LLKITLNLYNNNILIKNNNMMLDKLENKLENKLLNKNFLNKKPLIFKQKFKKKIYKNKNNNIFFNEIKKSLYLFLKTKIEIFFINLLSFARFYVFYKKQLKTNLFVVFERQL